jgi:hypothetical protein
VALVALWTLKIVVPIGIPVPMIGPPTSALVKASVALVIIAEALVVTPSATDLSYRVTLTLLALTVALAERVTLVGLM